MAFVGARRALLSRKKPVAAGGGTLAFNASATTPAWQVGGFNSPYTFPANIGSASPDRMVVAVIAVDGSAAQGNITGVTLGAGLLPMTPGPSIAPSGSFGAYLFIFYLKETTLSGLQNFVITTSGAFPTGVGMQVGMITGSNTVSFSSSGTTAPLAPSPDAQSITASSAVPANGVAVTGVIVDRSFTPSWTGATNDKLVSEITGNIYSMAMAHGTVNNPSFNGANNFGVGMVIATFGP